LVFIIAMVKNRNQDKYAKHWAGLVAVFLYASIDEGSSIHELFMEPLRNMFNTDGTFLHFAWVLFGAGLVSILVILYFRFWLHLPPKTRWLFFLASATYVTGSIGVELIGGYYYSNIGVDYWYDMLVFLEESLEITGAIL